MTPAGIEPATFRFVAQRLNDCATAQGINVTVEIIGTEGHCLATCYKSGRLVYKNRGKQFPNHLTISK